MCELSGIPETMLITLWAKAEEGKRDNPIIIDKKSEEVIEKISYDFSRFEKSWMSQLGVSVRTMLFDNVVNDFLQRNDQGVIINIGAGLDTRFERLDSERIKCWYDLDLYESIGLRKKFFDESARNKFIAKSVFDLSWVSEIASSGSAVMIIAEGVFMYFNEVQVRYIFEALSESFPGAEMVIDTIPAFLVGKAKHHDSLKTVVDDNSEEVEFKWALNEPRRIEEMNPSITFIDSWNLYDYAKNRWSWLGWLNRIPYIRRRMSTRVVNFKFS